MKASVKAIRSNATRAFPHRLPEESYPVEKITLRVNVSLELKDWYALAAAMRAQGLSLDQLVSAILDSGEDLDEPLNEN